MKSRVAQKYLELVEHSKLPFSKQIKQYLESGEEINEESEVVLNICFPGNETYSFNSRLKDEDMQPIAISYMACVVNIKHIDLSYNKLTDKGITVLAKLLEFAENICSVNLMGNQIGDVGCEKIATSLKGKIFLHTLNLNTNIFGNYGILCINELLFTNPAILNLNLGCNRYDWEGIIGITGALTTINTTLQALNLDDPMYKIQDQHFFNHFGKMLLSNTGLKKLSLRLHKIRFEAVSIITENLMHNNSLFVLDLSGNQICFQGMEFLTKYLVPAEPGETFLRSINLSSNKICDQGAKIFAQGIAGNKSLVHVDLTSNGITDEGLCRLAEGFSQNESVKSFKVFWNNKFELQSIKCFAELLKLKGDDFYPDFVIYEDCIGDWNIAYKETHIPNEEEFLSI